MASRMKEVLREKHWAVPGLSRIRTPATDMYPYLHTERAQPRSTSKADGKLLADSARKSCSPLGGQAVSEVKGKR
jgi:hypothetical protein